MVFSYTFVKLKDVYQNNHQSDLRHFKAISQKERKGEKKKKEVELREKSHSTHQWVSVTFLLWFCSGNHNVKEKEKNLVKLFIFVFFLELNP